jgi:hypothetical protein
MQQTSCVSNSGRGDATACKRIQNTPMRQDLEHATVRLSKGHMQIDTMQYFEHSALRSDAVLACGEKREDACRSIKHARSNIE